jgi:tRNA threonylcarbamoyladenosine biosynthesis protein TsaE
MISEPLILTVTSLEDTWAIAISLANLLQPGVVLLLYGNLGSGKTTFVQALAQGLGIKDSVTSPTFTLIDEYTDGRMPLYHMDLYRLEPDQVRALHVDEYWRGVDFPLGVVAIEWAERLELPVDHYLKMEFAIASQADTRQIRLTAKGEQCLKIVSELLNTPFLVKD